MYPVAIDLLSNDDTGAGLQSVRLDTVPPADQGTLTYTDANGTVVQIAPASPPTLTPAQAATLSFTPAPGFVGNTTPLAYTLFDTNGASDSARASIQVNGIPDLADDSFATPSDTAIAPDILANDIDFGDGIATVTVNALPDAAQGVLSYETIPGDAATRTALTAGQALTADQADSLLFTPTAGFFGIVDPVTYTVTDTDGDTDTATLSGSVATLVDATDDSYQTNPALVIPEGTDAPLGLIANDSFNDPATAVTFSGLPDATQGVLTYTDANGTLLTLDPAVPATLTPAEAATLSFAPAEGVAGPITPFTYTLTASDGGTDSASVELFVDLLPEAVDDAFVVEEGANADLSTLISGPIGADDQGDGPATVTLTSLPDPAQGLLTYVNASGVTVQLDAADLGTAAAVLDAQALATLTFVPEDAAGTPTDFSGQVDPIGYTLTDAGWRHLQRGGPHHRGPRP